MTSSSNSLPFVLKTNLHPVYHHPILPPISADSILTNLQASTRSSSSKRSRSPSPSPSLSSPATPRAKIQKRSSSSPSSSVPPPHHFNFNPHTLSPSHPQPLTLFDQPNPHTLPSEPPLSTSISNESPNLSNVNQLDFKLAVSSIDSILQNDDPSNSTPSLHQSLLPPSTPLIGLENIQSSSHSLLPSRDCPNPLSSSKSPNPCTISLPEELPIEPAITPSSSPLSSPLSSPPSIGPTHTPQASLFTSPSDHLSTIPKPSDLQEQHIQSSSSPQKPSSDNFAMPTLLKLTPSKPALPLTIPYSPSSTQTVQNLPSSTLPGLLTCTTTYPTPLSPSISSLDPSEEKSLKKSATIQQGDVAKSPDVQSSVLGKPFQEGPQKTTSTSVNDSTPPTLKHLHYHNKSSPGSINRSKGFFSRTLMSERPEEMTNILPESIELGTLFQTGSPHLCPPDRSPPTRKSPTKPLIMESNESVTKLSEALIELQSEKENGEGSMVKRPTRGSKISQRLEAMKKQTKRKAGRVESAIPIPNSEGPLTIFREPSRESKKDPSVKLMTLTKRFTSLNENRACVLKVEDWEMNKPRPTSPVSFSKSCRQYIKAHEDEDEDCGFEDSETIEKSESSRKVKWKKPLAEDVEIVGKLIKVPKKGILVNKKENQLDSDGNLIIESNMKILPEFVIVKRKVWSR